MTMYAGDEFYDDDVTSGVQPYPGQVSSARESAESTRSRLCVEPEQGTPSADDGRGPRNSLPHKRSGAEPSGVTPVRAADGPGATSSDGGSPETERAMSSDTPDRSQLR